MPANLVEGREADAVAAYVAQSVAKPGEDEGLLATAVEKAGGGEPAVAEDGVIEIASDPNGQLLYVTDQASAEPGPLEMNSPNESQVPHNIALEGNGLSPVLGPVVQDGGVSTINVEVRQGTYTYFCSVPGHREAGMQGRLTVEE
jgi:plastocyanin